MTLIAFCVTAHWYLYIIDISASEGCVAAERALWMGGKLLAGKYGFFRKARKVLLFRRSIDLKVMAAGKAGSDEALRKKTVFRQKIAALDDKTSGINEAEPGVPG